MGDPKGFLKVKRKETSYRRVEERLKDNSEVSIMRSEGQSQQQASRCMDCGTPFCHWACPLGNYIPEWNDLMFKGCWQKAFELLEASNNFPEITGRVCPAMCEYGCVLSINDDAVTVRENELAVVEYAFAADMVKPLPPKVRTGKKVAVVGSGPAGLACAVQLNKAGHEVTVFERDDKIGGILRYGIPDFKLEKYILDRRIEIWKKEGIIFRTAAYVGSTYSVSELLRKFDAVCLAGGSRIPRDLKIEGRDLTGIYFAMDYLIQANRRVAGEEILQPDVIDARGKRVVIIGGGDTGADCVGTAHRQGAAHVVQIELLPKPAECRTEEYPWPTYPLLLKTSSSHQEGGERHWSVLTKRFSGEGAAVKRLECVRVEFTKDDRDASYKMREVTGSNFHIDAELVILAIGFLGPERDGLLSGLGVELDSRNNVKTDSKYMTSIKGVFSAGDMRRGQSLVAWALSEGRRAARCMDEYLMGESNLPVM